jgi:hypothetical protein
VRVEEVSGFLMVWETVSRNYFLIFFSPLEIRVFFFAISTAVTLHVLTHCIISRKHWEQM